MSKLEKLKFINNVSIGWKVMFELYDWIRWSNENDYDSYAEYSEFMKLCENKLLKLGLDKNSIPRYTNESNWVSRWFKLERRFKNIRDMKKLIDHDDYKINLIRGKIQLRVKRYDKI